MNKRKKKKMLEWSGTCPVCNGFIYCSVWHSTKWIRVQHFCENGHTFERERNGYKRGEDEIYK